LFVTHCRLFPRLVAQSADGRVLAFAASIPLRAKNKNHTPWGYIFDCNMFKINKST
jgi:hypothetical protein